MIDHIAIIIITNMALYFKTLQHRFVSDDLTVFHVSKTMKFKNGWHMAWQRFIGACKFMSKSGFIVRGSDLKGRVSFSDRIKKNKKYLVLHDTEEFEHLITILIHTAICISIYFAFGQNWVSFIASMLYSVNPANNQATIWPGGRGYALPILSLNLAMALPILSPILLYFCSWFTIGFLAPLTLIGSSHWYILVSMPFVWWIHSRKYTTAIKLKSSYETFEKDKIWDATKIVVYFKTLGFYLLLGLTAFRITFYHNLLQSMAGNEYLRRKALRADRYFWAGLTYCVGTVVYACLHWGPLAWALIAYIVAISPFCNVVRANQEIAERFCALANVFLMYAVAIVIAAYPPIITAWLAYFAARTYYTVDMYKDEYWITELSCIEDPHAWWVWHCRALKRWETQSYREAMILWAMANIISPHEFKVLMNIAACLRIMGNNAEADKYLKLAQDNIIPGQEVPSNEYIEAHKSGKISILV